MPKAEGNAHDAPQALEDWPDGNGGAGVRDEAVSSLDGHTLPAGWDLLDGGAHSTDHGNTYAAETSYLPDNSIIGRPGLWDAGTIADFDDQHTDSQGLHWTADDEAISLSLPPPAGTGLTEGCASPQW